MWIFSTRSRLENCKRFIKSWEDTEALTPVYVRLDDCDPQLLKLLNLPWPKTFIINVGPRVRLSQAMQELFIKYPNEEWYGMLADDLIPRTKHWDQKLIDRAVPNNISYANSIHEDPKLICHPCVGGDLVRLVGFFGLPAVTHFGTDTVWQQIHHEFNRNNRLDDVILEHAHFVYNQSVLDKTYEESQKLKDQDKKNFRHWKKNTFPEIIEKIKQEYKW